MLQLLNGDAVIFLASVDLFVLVLGVVAVKADDRVPAGRLNLVVAADV